MTTLHMKRILTTLAWLALSAAAFMAWGQPMQQLPNDPAVRKGQLDNGLTYYIRHNERPQGRAEFYLATHVGAIQETPDQDGLAHFLEHMCFNGTRNFPEKGILDWLQSIGASFGGNVNASTGVEQTVYMLNNIPLVRETVVDTCILIMHDYAHFVTNDPVEIDKERPVIIEERRARRNAAWRMHEKSLPYYYGDSKYAGCTVIGSQENLETFKPESLTAFYRTWYHPHNQALIVIGDVDVDRTEQRIRDIFADIPAAVDPQAKAQIRVPDNTEPVVGIITDPEASSTSIQLLWKSEAVPPALNSTLAGKLDETVKSLIGNIMDERFEDISAQADAPFIRAGLGIGNLCESMEAVMGTVMCREGEALPALRSLYTEIEKMKRYGFTEEEAQRARTNLLTGYESAANKADTRQNAELVYELIGNFFNNESYMVPQEEFQLMQQLLPMVSTDILNQAAAQMITDTNLVIVYQAPDKEGAVHPTRAELVAVLDEVRHSDIAPNEAEAMATELLDPSVLKGARVRKSEPGLYGSTCWQLKNGVKVILYPSDLEKDKITFSLSMDGGKSLIPPEDLPSFEDNVWALFLRNTGVSRFSSTTLNKMLAGKEVSVSPNIGNLRHSITGRAAPKDLETAFQLMYLFFTDPRFDPTEYAQGINQIQAVLPNLVAQPNYKLQEALYNTLYGDNPRVLMISPEVLAEANLATIEKNYRNLFKDAAGASVVIAGDFVPDTIKPLVEKYFGSLPKGRKARRWVDPQTDILPGERTRDFTTAMETPKSTAVAVFTAPTPYSVETDVALSAASYILDMRYVKSLREEEGGTYGASTEADLSREPKEVAMIQVAFNANPASTDRLRELALEGLRQLAADGPTEEEFDMTLKNLQKNLPESRIRNNWWVNALRQHERYGIDFDKAYEAAVDALTPDAIRDAVAHVLAAGNCAEVVQRPAE